MDRILEELGHGQRKLVENSKGNAATTVKSESIADLESAVTCDVGRIEEMTAGYFKEVDEAAGDVDAVKQDYANPLGYVFHYKGSVGIFQDSTRYLKRKDALHFILQGDNPRWASDKFPPGLPESKIGSFIYLVKLSAFDTSKDVTADWLRPWNSVGPCGRRITPKWEKTYLKETKSYLRTSKSRHPIFSFVRRQVIFLSDADGTPISSTFYQYVIESEGNFPLSEDDSSTSFTPILKTANRGTINLGKREGTPLTETTKPKRPPSHDRDVDPVFTAALASILQGNLSRDESSEMANDISSSSVSGESKADDSVEQIVETILDSVVSCRQAIRATKRKYCETNNVSEMKQLSSQCESLASWLEEMQSKLQAISTTAAAQLESILSSDSHKRRSISSSLNSTSTESNVDRKPFII